MKYERLTDRKIAEMLRNTEGESWDSDNVEAQCYIRLAELEDKIEGGKLVEVPQGSELTTLEERRKAMKAFGERVKMAFYYEFDELIPSIMADKIDEIIEEIVEGTK